MKPADERLVVAENLLAKFHPPNELNRGTSDFETP